MPKFLAKVEREKIDGELVDIRLKLYRDKDVLHVEEGDEFVTVDLVVNPFDGEPTGTEKEA